MCTQHTHLISNVLCIYLFIYLIRNIKPKVENHISVINVIFKWITFIVIHVLYWENKLWYNAIQIWNIYNYNLHYMYIVHCTVYIHTYMILIFKSFIFPLFLTIFYPNWDSESYSTNSIALEKDQDIFLEFRENIWPVWTVSWMIKNN